MSCTHSCHVHVRNIGTKLCELSQVFMESAKSKYLFCHPVSLLMKVMVSELTYSRGFLRNQLLVTYRIIIFVDFFLPYTCLVTLIFFRHHLGKILIWLHYLLIYKMETAIYINWAPINQQIKYPFLLKLVLNLTPPPPTSQTQSWVHWYSVYHLNLLIYLFLISPS